MLKKTIQRINNGRDMTHFCELLVARRRTTNTIKKNAWHNEVPGMNYDVILVNFYL